MKDGGELYTDHAMRNLDGLIANLRGLYDLEAGARDQAQGFLAALMRALELGVHDNFHSKSLSVVEHVKHVISHLVAYAVVHDGPSSWREAFDPRDSLINEMICDFMPDHRQRNLQRTIIWHVSQWILEGRRVFSPTPNLCKRLERVKLENVAGSDIVPPYRSFYVCVPHGVGLPVPDNTGRHFPLRGLYVIEDDYDDYRDFEGRCLHIMAIGQWIRMGNSGHFDDQIYYCTVRLEDENPSQWITKGMKRAWDGEMIDNSGFLPSSEAGKLERLSDWIWNFLAYVSDSEIRQEVRYLDPRVEKLHAKLRKHPRGRKRDRAKEELRGCSKQRVIVIGSDVAAPGQSLGVGHTLEIRQRVRGHRKRQPCGPRQQDRKEIRIQPYWRGPEDGEEGGSRFMLR